MHQGKNHFNFFNGPDQAENRNQARIRKTKNCFFPPNFPQIQANSALNFHNFLKFHQPKVHFFSRPSKTPEFYPIKNIFFSKRYTGKKKEKKWDIAWQNRRPQKGRKNRFWFFPIFFAFLCRSRRGDHFYSIHAYPYSIITEMRALLRKPAISAFSFRAGLISLQVCKLIA